ncbi:ribonuclease 3-like protein 3 [Herrania umbratica]|uniref:Ribonuclease 3-like protein 3 n=1 Tax=Herrania umbratica TaxID=108875 RepID=A0A6J1BMH3_9ROSI|nr:ribonuclease 3-like protein 3 [Herrania umbratica]
MTAMDTLEEEALDRLQMESAVESAQIDSLPSLDEVEDILGYQFNNKGLLEEAFTHASLGKSFSNERLEYVGDSVLNLLFTKHQYFEYPDLPPGALTRLRAANVDTEKLARVAFKHGLHRYLRHKKPLLEEQVSDKKKFFVFFFFFNEEIILSYRDNFLRDISSKNSDFFFLALDFD